MLNNDFPKIVYVCYGETPDGETHQQFSFSPESAKIKLLEIHPNAKYITVAMYTFDCYTT